MRPHQLRSEAADGRNRECLRERAPQCGVNLLHACGDTEPGERGHSVLGDPARNDAAVMLEFGVNIERDSMISDPLTHADADRGDLFLFPRGPHDPYADAAVAPFAAYLEAGECPDDPLLEVAHVAAHILPAPTQIQHHIGDPLA